MVFKFASSDNKSETFFVMIRSLSFLMSPFCQHKHSPEVRIYSSAQYLSVFIIVWANCHGTEYKHRKWHSAQPNFLQYPNVLISHHGQYGYRMIHPNDKYFNVFKVLPLLEQHAVLLRIEKYIQLCM
jgi:hypothetical protein